MYSNIWWSFDGPYEYEQDHKKTAADVKVNINITQRLNKFSTQIGDNYAYRTPLMFLSDIEKVNQPAKTDLKIKCNLKR